MRATIAYTGMRLLLFLGALLVLYLLGAREILLFALAVLVSGVVSFIVLSRQRDAMSGALVRWARGLRTRLEDGTRAEDGNEE